MSSSRRRSPGRRRRCECRCTEATATESVSLCARRDMLGIAESEGGSERARSRQSVRPPAGERPRNLNMTSFLVCWMVRHGQARGRPWYEAVAVPAATFNARHAAQLRAGIKPRRAKFGRDRSVLVCWELYVCLLQAPRENCSCDGEEGSCSVYRFTPWRASPSGSD